MKLLFHQLIFRPAFCTLIFLSFLFYITGHSNQAIFSKSVLSGSVKVVKIPKWTQNRWKYFVQSKNYAPMTIYSATSLFQYGGTYHVKGQIKSSNPQVLTLSSSPYQIRPPSIWHKWAVQIHNEFLNFTELYLTQKTKPFLQALLFNIRDSVEPEFFDALCRTNLVHIFSISGMHVMIFWKLLDFLLQKMPLPRICRAISIITLLYLYVIATGFQPPAFRAWIMALFVTLSQLTHYEPDSLNLLGVAGCIILILQPYALNELSFQLSFLCCLGLILFATSSKIFMRPSFSQKALHLLENTLHTTLIANLFSLPLVAFKFHMISLLGWTLNLLIVPFAPFIIYLGVFCWMLSYINPFLTNCIAKFILVPLIHIAVQGIYIFSNFIGSAILVPIFSVFWVILIYLLMILFWRPKRKMITHS